MVDGMKVLTVSWRVSKSIEVKDGLWVKEELEVTGEVMPGANPEEVEANLQEYVNNRVNEVINEEIENLIP